MPEFTKPPIAEVALGVQLRPLDRLRTPHLGLFWERTGLRDRLPRIEEHAPIEPALESFDQPQPPSIRVSSFSQRSPARCWFLNAEGDELLQIQQDRLLYNWRRRVDGDVYPRYDAIRAKFKEAMLSFFSFLESQSLGNAEPIQCEVTYVDHIEWGDSSAGHTRVGDALRVCSFGLAAGAQRALESCRIGATYGMLSDSGHPIGRLRLDAAPAYRSSDNRPILVMTSVARGAPIGAGAEGVLRFLDQGHDRLIDLFLKFTSEEAQQSWR